MNDYRISSSFFGVVLSVRVAFSKRSWPYLLATVIPWLLCAGQRSITRMAKLADFKRSLSGYYRFLSDGKWRMELLFKCLFELIVKTFKIKELTLVLDDTLSPSRTTGNWKTGARSSSSRTVGFGERSIA